MPAPVDQTLHVQLCVIGCGPTGVAALLEARRLGIDAIGVEKGQSALAAIAAHPESLSYVSDASKFEVAGLPLDCRDPKSCTREEVLHYYARLVNWARLRIRVSARCVAISPRADDVVVTVDTPTGTEQIIAHEVLVTSWYVKRMAVTVEESRDAGARRPIVLAEFRNPAQFAGMDVVVYGGGQSGYEYATSLMLAGARIALATRGHRVAPSGELFAQLLARSGSVVRKGVSEVRLADGGVCFHDADGSVEHRQCEVVLCATGAEVDVGMLNALVRADVLSPELAHRLVTAPSFEDSGIPPETSLEDRIAIVVAERPDLWDWLFDGRHGVRFAGGILHGGASNAGVVVSIATARLAVRAAAGVPTPDWERPLTRALTRVEQVRQAAAWTEDAHLLKALVPLRRADFSREGSGHLGPSAPGHETKAGPVMVARLSELDAALIAAADGSCTIGNLLSGALAERHSSTHIVESLMRLFYNGVLTWIPSDYSWDSATPSAIGLRSRSTP